MQSLKSSIWDGEVGLYPAYKVELMASLNRESCGFAIIPAGIIGYMPLRIDPLYPGFETRGVDGVNRRTTQEQFDKHIEKCRKNTEARGKDDEKFAKAFTMVLDSLGKDATRKIKHIRDDITLSYREKAQSIIPALENAFFPHSANVRTELKQKIEDLQDIDSRETALKAIEVIDDVNREIAKHINPATGHAQHFQQNDADKIEKYLNLLQGGYGTLFHDAKVYLVRSNDAGQLTWALLTAEIERTCDNIKSDEQKASVRKVSQVSIGKSYEDGLREGFERSTASSNDRSRSYDRGASRDRGDYGRRREPSASRDRGDYRRRREPSADRDNRRDGGSSSYDRGRNDSRDRDGGRDSRSRGDSPFRSRDESSGRFYREESSGRDRRGRSPNPARKDFEDERVGRLVAAFMKQQPQGGKSPGRQE